MAKKNEAREPSFEELLAEAEGLAEKMEEGGLSLEDSIAAYEKGVDNLRKCAALLRSAEEKVKTLVEEQGGFRLDDFGPTGDPDLYGEEIDEA